MAAVDLHHRYLHKYLHHLTGQWQDAEDLLQELWRYVVVHFPEEKIQSIGLLRRKAYQLFVDRYRSARRRPETCMSELPEIACKGCCETGFSEEQEAELKAKFWSGFLFIELTEMQKEVLWSYARYGYTYHEMESQFSIPASTIGDWVALGRQRLAAYINLH
jgi:DNA-directed RNA polymerase specialized sigma24 family protein